MGRYGVHDGLQLYWWREWRSRCPHLQATRTYSAEKSKDSSFIEQCGLYLSGWCQLPQAFTCPSVQPTYVCTYSTRSQWLRLSAVTPSYVQRWFSFQLTVIINDPQSGGSRCSYTDILHVTFRGAKHHQCCLSFHLQIVVIHNADTTCCCSATGFKSHIEGFREVVRAHCQQRRGQGKIKRSTSG